MPHGYVIEIKSPTSFKTYRLKERHKSDGYTLQVLLAEKNGMEIHFKDLVEASEVGNFLSFAASQVESLIKENGE